MFLKNIGIVGKICQPVMVKILQIWNSSLNKKNFKKYWKTEKHCKSQGNLSV